VNDESDQEGKQTVPLIATDYPEWTVMRAQSAGQTCLASAMSYLPVTDDNGKQIRFSIVLLSFFVIMLARASVEFGDNMLRALPLVVVISILVIDDFGTGYSWRLPESGLFICDGITGS